MAVAARSSVMGGPGQPNATALTPCVTPLGKVTGLKAVRRVETGSLAPLGAGEAPVAAGAGPDVTISPSASDPPSPALAAIALSGRYAWLTNDSVSPIVADAMSVAEPYVDAL